MRRRYSTATYLRRLEPLAGEFNLTSDVIVGFPAEDEAAFERTLAHGRGGRAHAGPRLPVLAAARHRDRGRRPRPAAVKKERGARLRALSHELERRRWQAKLGTHDVVLVDRPGRGYGDDYSPFLVDAPVGELVRVRAERRDRGGNRCRRSVTTASSASSIATATTSQRRRASSRSTTSTRRHPCTCS